MWNGSGFGENGIAGRSLLRAAIRGVDELLRSVRQRRLLHGLLLLLNRNNRNGKDERTMNRQGIHIDEKAWREYRSRLLQFIRGRMRDREQAEDVLQEVLVKIWSQLKSLKNEESLLPWMYRIARNGVIDHYRTGIGTTDSLEGLDERHEPILQPEDATESQQAERELAECLRPMIRALPPHYGRALLLTDISGMSQVDLAEKEGISISGAKSRVQRGRGILKEMIEECCRLEFDARGRIADYAARGCGTNCGTAACDDPGP